jgi:hypothetical protein
MRVAALLALAGLGGALAGCGTHGPPHSIAVQTYRGFPAVDPAFGPGVHEPTVIRMGTTRLAMTFFGSGSCPPVPISDKWINATTLQVDVDASYPGACTSDEAATTSVLSVLPHHLPSGTFTVQFTGRASQVPAAAIVR